ncbi:bifunctional transcriptional activator/DNA repair enzyme AdaA [Paenibacillus bouchesdurhonensis]|uniref:bifunctional transcriptional activator/DNA repair enzyme AdaA n=1 Tax=Paenibacillus bouchesdurhonensis TaxID=1870990 RepID=UPI000DA624DE|nr:bifunctional transcriptional activator/DNA repair enzyme AdaA [Paenibacillus bouchesdurhonensis]
MSKLGQPLSDEKWQAIIQNDASCDDKFIYAVESTGIFCRPSCKSRVPKREHVRIFDNTQQALAASFRPCKRCKPMSGPLPEEEWVEQIAGYIDAHYSEKLTLGTLAGMCHGSPYHLHRTFKRVKGVTPAFYILQTRIDKASEYLQKTDKAISEIALRVGMGSTSYFITVFKKMKGQTPAEYREKSTTMNSSEVLNYENDK